MTTSPLADYEREQAAFADLLQPRCAHRILLLQGDSGTGKTTLLSTCLERVPEHVTKIPINLQGSVVGVAEIFFRVGWILGWDRLSRFTRQVAELQGLPRVQIDNNWISGINNSISVALRAENPADQEHRRAALTEAWFEDLRELTSPVLMALDTYEQAPEETARWIGGPFLARAVQTESLRVLVAGQKVPDANTIEWGHCCTTYQLFGVPEARHWLPIVLAMNKEIPIRDPETWLAGVCYALHGNPNDIMQIISGLPRREVVA